MKANHLRAIGISYKAGSDNAPTVNVKGEGCDADLIVKMALRYGVPVIERKNVAKLLGEVPLESEIPTPLFEAVATIITELEN